MITDKMLAYNRILKSEYPAVAKRIVSGIERQALSIGWTQPQLDKLASILSAFIPAKIGTITLRAIEVITLHHDGSPRGATNFYNMDLKRGNKLE